MLELICQVVGHKRSRRQIHHDGNAWLSTCRICGQPMIRVRRGVWKLADTPPMEMPGTSSG